MKKLLTSGLWTTVLLLAGIGSAQACNLGSVGCDNIGEYDDWNAWTGRMYNGSSQTVHWEWDSSITSADTLDSITVTLNYDGVPDDNSWEVAFSSGGDGGSILLDADGQTEQTWTGSFLQNLFDNQELTFSFNRLGSDYKLTLKSLTLEANCSQVPIPAAGWLFGSALFGALAVGRRKTRETA